MILLAIPGVESRIRRGWETLLQNSANNMLTWRRYDVPRANFADNRVGSCCLSLAPAGAVADLFRVRRKLCVRSHIRLRRKSTPIRSRFCAAGSSRASCKYRLRPAGSGASSPLSGAACLPRPQVRWQMQYPTRPEKTAPKYIARFQRALLSICRIRPKTRALRNMGLWTSEIHVTPQEAALSPDDFRTVHFCLEKSGLERYENRSHGTLLLNRLALLIPKFVTLPRRGHIFNLSFLKQFVDPQRKFEPGTHVGIEACLGQRIGT
jgi:hypothetical protein